MRILNFLLIALVCFTTYVFFGIIAMNNKKTQSGVAHQASYSQEKNRISKMNAPLPLAKNVEGKAHRDPQSVNNQINANAGEQLAASQPNYEDPRYECRMGKRDACQMLGRSCQEGDYEACFSVGSLLAEKDITKAMPYFKAACEQINHVNSCYEIAMILLDSRDESHKDRIFSYLNISCFGGNATACLKLAEVDPDPAQRDLYLAEAHKFQTQEFSGTTNTN